MDRKIEDESDSCDEDCHTKKEAIDAIRSLDETGYVKLMVIARFFARIRFNSMSRTGDLLHDAIVKTIDGRRRWKKGISIIKHLDRTMESDSWHIRIHNSMFKETPISENGNEPTELSIDERNHIDAVLDIDRILNLIFDNDAEANDLLKLQMQGLSASDIRQKMELNKTQYGTIMKRIRRRFLQFIHSEEKDHE